MCIRDRVSTQSTGPHRHMIPQPAGDTRIGERIMREYLELERIQLEQHSQESGGLGGDEYHAVSSMQVEYFSLVPTPQGDVVKLLSEETLRDSTAAVQSLRSLEGGGVVPHKMKAPRGRVWSEETDRLIINLVEKYGAKHWSQIAAHVPGRSGKQCRERWQHHLCPDIKKEPWSQEEDMILIVAHRTYGNKWAQIAKLLPGRTDNGIKNRWNTTLRRRLTQAGATKRLKVGDDTPMLTGPEVPEQLQDLGGSTVIVPAAGSAPLLPAAEGMSPAAKRARTTQGMLPPFNK
eukprot:TRINITY_DN3256_c0_g1_i1.p1 TRINITY_DN3256_c0_g1~~TRINITY_DN3256_c0_g1_i1.p1  ORF type:complete len:316 (-),score=59.94 TRINITY_DN3256_c0_g1_i1:353-1222(-)